MKRIWLACGVVVLVLGVAIATSFGQSPPTNPPAPGTQGPSAGLRMEPFDVGGPAAIWPDEQLTPAERAVADRVHDAATNEAEFRAGFAAASTQLEQRALLEKAEHELGVEDLLEEGVVP